MDWNVKYTSLICSNIIAFFYGYLEIQVKAHFTHSLHLPSSHSACCAFMSREQNSEWSETARGHLPSWQTKHQAPFEIQSGNRGGRHILERRKEKNDLWRVQRELWRNFQVVDQSHLSLFCVSVTWKSSFYVEKASESDVPWYDSTDCGQSLEKNY